MSNKTPSEKAKGKVEPSLTAMRKHLTIYNKMVRDETYKGVSKMKADRVREVFRRDFREIKSGKDGKTYFAPKKYDFEIDEENMIPALKELSKDLRQNKPQTKSEEPAKKKAKAKEDTKQAAKPAEASAPAEKKAEPKKEETKAPTLKKLVSIAQSHKKNGISQEGLKAFSNMVKEYQKTNPPKLERQLAGVLYNYLLNNILLGKKRMPKNLNRALTQLGLKTF